VILSYFPNKRDQFRDLFPAQFAFATGHLVLALGNDLRQFCIRLASAST
jgi:hypothetical protein